MSEVSQKQLEANRENAKLGGVKTEEGKAVSKYNAIKHGILSQEVLLKGEDEKSLIELGKKLRTELKPETEIELLLVDRIASNIWRLKRALGFEENDVLYEFNGKFGLKNDADLFFRYEIMLEQYFKTINIEAETTQTLAKTMIQPAAIRYFNELAATVDRGSTLGLDTIGSKALLIEVNGLFNDLVIRLNQLVEVNEDLGGETITEKCDHMYENVIPAMNAVREVADKLERILPDDFWPLPTYREMLFVK